VTKEDRDSWAARVTPFYPLIDLLNQRHGERYSVYVLFGENAAWFAQGRFLGDRIGPGDFDKITAVAGDAAALASTLEALGVEYFLFDSAVFQLPPGPQFRFVARSGSTELHQLTPRGADSSL
jgi:hypothetical protein